MNSGLRTMEESAKPSACRPRGKKGTRSEVVWEHYETVAFKKQLCWAGLLGSGIVFCSLKPYTNYCLQCIFPISLVVHLYLSSAALPLSVEQTPYRFCKTHMPEDYFSWTILKPGLYCSVCITQEDDRVYNTVRPESAPLSTRTISANRVHELQHT